MKSLLIILMSIFTILIAVGLWLHYQPADLNDLADQSLSKYFTCIENTQSEAACEAESEKASQDLSKIDVSESSDFANKQLQSREDCWSEESCEELNFKRVRASCYATYECETYSCLRKNLWRCQ